jgi:hypothetical protein
MGMTRDVTIPSFMPGAGKVDFSRDAWIEDVEDTKGVSPPRGRSPSGDAKLGGAPLTMGGRYTMADQRVADETRSVGRTPTMSLEDQICQGLDQEKMGALNEQCLSGQLSVNDLAAALMIIMLKNALENKTIERQMRAELALVTFLNGMKIAELIKLKGELAYKKAIFQAGTQLASCVANFAVSKLVEKALTPGGSHGEANLAEEGKLDSTKTGPIEAERMAARKTGELAGNLVGQAISSTGMIVEAEFDLGISKIDAQIKVLEATNQLIASISQSVQSSITSQEQAIQFALSMMEKIFSLAHQTASSLTNNTRV